MSLGIFSAFYIIKVLKVFKSICLHSYVPYNDILVNNEHIHGPIRL